MIALECPNCDGCGDNEGISGPCNLCEGKGTVCLECEGRKRRYEYKWGNKKLIQVDLGPCGACGGSGQGPEEL